MSEMHFIVCSPWSEETLMAIPGNRTAECDSCSEPVIISRQGRRMRESSKVPTQILCLRCARLQAPETEILPVPGAVEAAHQAGASVKFTDALRGKRLKDVLDEDGEWIR